MESTVFRQTMTLYLVLNLLKTGSPLLIYSQRLLLTFVFVAQCFHIRIQWNTRNFLTHCHQQVQSLANCASFFFLPKVQNSHNIDSNRFNEIRVQNPVYLTNSYVCSGQSRGFVHQSDKFLRTSQYFCILFFVLIMSYLQYLKNFTMKSSSVKMPKKWLIVIK